MIDLLDLAIMAEAVPVTHEVQTGSYVAGKWVKGTPVTTAIMATVQPASGRQLMDMPEGIRTEAKYVAWTGTALVVDDIVIYAGSRYRVIYTWPRPADSFTRAALGLTK